MLDRAKIANILVVPLLALLIGLWWSKLRPPAPIQPTPAAPAVPSSEPQAPDVGAEPASSPFQDQAPLLTSRDPFQWPHALIEAIRATEPSQGSAAAPARPPMPSLKLQGIFWNTTPSRAIINDQILTEGDTIQGVQIIEIRPSAVTIEYDGDRSTLQPVKLGQSPRTTTSARR